MLNHWHGIGHLGEDPEEVEEKGRAAARLRLATNYRGGKAVWHDVIVLGTRGQACLHGLRTGSRIAVQGRLRYRGVWNEEEECFERRTEIVAVGDVLFLDRREDPPGEDDEDRLPTDEELCIPPGYGDENLDPDAPMPF